MKNMFKKSLLTLMLLFTFCLIGSVKADAAIQFTSVEAKSVNTTSVTIAWGILGTQDGYDVQLSLNGNNWFSVGSGYSLKSISANGLTPNTLYYARVIVTDKTDKKDYPSSAITFATSPTAPARPDSPTQVSATPTSVGISWTAVAGATGYVISTSDGIDLLTVQTNNAVIPNLVQGGSYNLRVRAYTTGISGATVVGDTSYTSTAKTTPTKVLAVGVSYYWYYINKQTFACSAVTNADGYEFQAYNSAGKCVFTDTATGSSYSATASFDAALKKGDFYKYRARAYITVGTAKIYGAWSNYNFLGIPSSTKATTGSRKINYSWSKVKGATAYTVYISDKSSTTGYKKVKKLSAKSRSITIKKYGKKSLKKGKTYYVKVVVSGKSGTTKGTSTQYMYSYGTAR